MTAGIANSIFARGATYRGFETSFNWTVQGSDAGLYKNDDIHAMRILLLEPTSDTRPKSGRSYYNHGRERYRILGEIPVRHFASLPRKRGERLQSRPAS